MESDEATKEPINEPKMKKPKIWTSMTVRRSMTSLHKVSTQKLSWMSSDMSPKPPQKAQSSSKLPADTTEPNPASSWKPSQQSKQPLSSYYYSSSEEESITTESTPPRDTLPLKVKVLLSKAADDSISPSAFADYLK